MMKYIVNECPQCAAPLEPGSCRCDSCGSVFEKVRVKEVDPFYVDRDHQEWLMKQFGKAAKANPNDLNSNFGMGLVFLSRSQFTKAQECFKKAIEKKPNDADVYYYYVLSLCAAEPLSQIPSDKCEEIRECLQASLAIERKRKYLILAMLFRQASYIGKGKALRKGESSPAKLLEEAMSIEGDDERTEQEIERFLSVDDKVSREYLAKVLGNGDAEVSTSAGLQDSLSRLSRLCKLPKGDLDRMTNNSNVQSLADPTVRQNFFRVLYEPRTPILESLPSIFKTFSNYLGAIFFLFLMLPILDFYVWDFSVYEKERQMSHRPVEEQLERRFGNYKERQFYNKRERKEFLENVEAERHRYDSILQVKKEKDSSFLARYEQVYFTYQLGKEEYQVNAPFTPAVLDTISPNAYHIVAHAEIKDKALLGKFLKTLPIYLLFLLFIYIVYKNISDRREKSRINGERKFRYKQEQEMYKVRPSVEDYKRFCQLYLGPNTGLVTKGDIVKAALDSLKLTDSSFNKGKLFFSNYFVTEDGTMADGDQAKPEEILRNMKVTIAVATGNSIKIMTGIWHTEQDEPIHFNTQNVYYNHIQAIQKSESKVVLIGAQGTRLAEIPIRGGRYGNLFCYQSVDSSDKLSYSETRTSDEIELERSLDSIIAENQK